MFSLLLINENPSLDIAKGFKNVLFGFICRQFVTKSIITSNRSRIYFPKRSACFEEDNDPLLSVLYSASKWFNVYPPISIDLAMKA